MVNAIVAAAKKLIDDLIFFNEIHYSFLSLKID